MIARWTVIVPLAEGAEEVTPYDYGENNPILMVDLDGMASDTGKIKHIQLDEVVIKGQSRAHRGEGLDYWIPFVELYRDY